MSSAAYILQLPPEVKVKRPYRKTIIWTDEMITKLTNEFPVRITIDICNEMGISLRTAIRKARELGLVKEDGFLDKNRMEISRRAQSSKLPNKNKGVKGFYIPGSEQYRFKKGQPSSMKNEAVKQKSRNKRNETILRERMRIAVGLPQKTKLKLKG